VAVETDKSGGVARIAQLRRREQCHTREGLDEVREDADTWESRRHAAAELARKASALMTGSQDAWEAGQLAQAKARFLEDHADEAVWEDHARSPIAARRPMTGL
jgi:hypothetical protein